MSTQLSHPEISVKEGAIDLWDPIERSSMGFSTPEAVSPTPVPTSSVTFPVDTAVTFETAQLNCDGLHDIHVWSVAGDFIAESTNGEPLFLPPGEYIFDITGPIKTYFQVESALQILPSQAETTVFFEDTVAVTLGVRSFHDHPAGEIPVTDDPYSLLEAIPFLASSLKTLSPERSFPTFRGHPPTLTRTDDPEALDAATKTLEKPDTGIFLEVPPTFQTLYPIAPLAFYLGADVLPNRTPQIRTPTQRVPLSTFHDEYDHAVSALLQHVFFLDCLTRTEGYFKVPLHERECFERRLLNAETGPDTLDFSALYDCSLGERLDAYLEVPLEVTEVLLPEWRLTADVEPVPASLECLPYLVADLAVIRCPDPKPVGDITETPQPLQDFFRDGSLEHPTIDFVATTKAASLEQTFVGDSKPLNASKASLETFESRFDRSLKRPEDIEVAVVINNPEMDAEGAAASAAYQRLETTGATVSYVDRTTTDELEAILESPVDFLHYVGHVDGRGLECADGYLDAAGSTEYGVDAFILNGCQSYTQGEALIAGGCAGGVVTASPILNDPAIDIGGTFARLLADGFSLSSATTIATERRFIGNQYLVLGDGELRIAETENTTPNLARITSTSTDTYSVTIETYPTNTLDMGCLFTPYLPGIETRYLTSGHIDELEVSLSALQEYLEQSSFPVIFEDELTWSSDLRKQL